MDGPRIILFCVALCFASMARAAVYPECQALQSEVDALAGKIANAEASTRGVQPKLGARLSLEAKQLASERAKLSACNQEAEKRRCEALLQQKMPVIKKDCRDACVGHCTAQPTPQSQQECATNCLSQCVASHSTGC